MDLHFNQDPTDPWRVPAPSRAYGEQEWHDLPSDVLVREGARWLALIEEYRYFEKSAFKRLLVDLRPASVSLPIRHQQYHEFLQAQHHFNEAVEQTFWYVRERDSRFQHMPTAQLMELWARVERSSYHNEEYTEYEQLAQER